MLQDQYVNERCTDYFLDFLDVLFVNQENKIVLFDVAVNTFSLFRRVWDIRRSNIFTLQYILYSKYVFPKFYFVLVFVASYWSYLLLIRRVNNTSNAFYAV
jgi:hypothetical protein